MGEVSAAVVALIRVLSGPVEDGVGLAGGDYLHELRLRNRDLFERRTREILQERDAKIKLESVDLRLVERIMEQAQDETRDELRELWARLMAAALDESRSSRVRRGFIETLEHFEPLDALVLKALHEGRGGRANERQGFAESLNKQPDEIFVSLGNLHKLGCAQVSGSAGQPMSEGANLHVTAYGRELMRAVE